MQLKALYVNGFRRFFDRTKLDVGGKLLAIVGPNEAGKSSLLHAMLSGDHRSPFAVAGPAQDLTREAAVPPDMAVVEAVFLVDDSDRDALASIPGAGVVRMVRISKHARGGHYNVRLEPPPRRDVSLRGEVLSALRALLAGDWEA